MTIKPLTYNVATLPEAIYKSFCSFGYTFSNGFDLSEAPFKMSIKLKDNENEYTCFFLTYKEFEYYYNQIDNKKLFDIDNNLIDRKAANDYLIAFAKGIENGYTNFLDKIKSDNELFTPENKDLAYKVYSKTIISFNNRLGSVNCFSTNKENNKYITTDMLFEQGVFRGEHHKAWELILKNPMQFEQFFKAAAEPIPASVKTPSPENHLICEKKLLQKLHADFDGTIWEKVEFETFLNYMRVEPIENIKPIVDNKEFARWLRANIEKKRDENLVPNMNKWFIKLIGKEINYSSQFRDY